jgi:hypothetical protein
MLFNERNWALPLEELDRKFDEGDNVIAEKFHTARSDLLREWRFLEIIWKRLQDNWKCYHERNTKIMQAIKNDKKLASLLTDSRSVDTASRQFKV